MIIKIVIVLICLFAIDFLIILRLDKHEIAIAELLKRHPDMLIDEEGEDI